MKNITISILVTIMIMSFGYSHPKGYRHNHHHYQWYNNPWKIKIVSHTHHDHNSIMKRKSKRVVFFLNQDHSRSH